MEMAVCLVIMAVAASVVVPAFSRLGSGKPESAGDQLLALLKQARNFAIERNYVVTVRIDPVSSRFRVDTTGTGGMGVSTMPTGSMPNRPMRNVISIPTRDVHAGRCRNAGDQS